MDRCWIVPRSYTRDLCRPSWPHATLQPVQQLSSRTPDFTFVPDPFVWSAWSTLGYASHACCHACVVGHLTQACDCDVSGLLVRYFGLHLASMVALVPHPSCRLHFLGKLEKLNPMVTWGCLGAAMGVCYAYRFRCYCPSSRELQPEQRVRCTLTGKALQTFCNSQPSQTFPQLYRWCITEES